MTDAAARLLVVDDNPAFAENLQEILGTEGYSTRAANSCAGALNAARDGVDLALVDVRLPDGDGISLAGQIKAEHPDSEVILLTGFATVESAAAAVRAGACAYLIKPCQTAQLLLTVEQAMRQVRLHREKRELGRRAQVAEKLAAVGTLTAGLSHEIRNPLNAAGLQLSILERRISRLPEEQKAQLQEPLTLVRDEIRRLDHILQDFLQFARPVGVVARPMSVLELLQKIQALFAADAAQRGVRLVVECSAELRVAGDEDRLRQVLVNLTINALHATPSGGEVRLHARRGGGEVELVVEDTGPGIASDHIGRLFEPFFTTKAEGSGLGLPIVHAIVTQHGGTVEVENAPGAGARFTLRLPSAS